MFTAESRTNWRFSEKNNECHFTACALGIFAAFIKNFFSLLSKWSHKNFVTEAKNRDILDGRNNFFIHFFSVSLYIISWSWSWLKAATVWRTSMTHKTIKENIKGKIFLSSFIVLFSSGKILKNLHNHGSHVHIIKKAKSIKLFKKKLNMNFLS